MKPPFSARKFCRTFVAPLLLALAPSAVHAQTLQTVVSYTFSGTTGAPTSTAAGVSGSNFIRDPADITFYDNTSGHPAPDTNSNGWTTSTLLDSTEYYTFTITPAVGGTSWNGLTLDVANFDAAQIDDGPTRFAVRSSLDGFASNLLTGTIGATFTTAATALNVTSGNPVEYRVYGFGAGTTQGLFQIDNVALTFASPVPEPSTLAGIGVAAAVAFAVFVRRRA